jgi:hypothetical protein
VAKNYWNWDCESISYPKFNRLIQKNTILTTAEKHSGKSSMQINVSAIGGNESSGADVRSVILNKIHNGKNIYYRWWMKLDAEFKWGNGTAYVKASRMKLLSELRSPRLWTGYLSKKGVFLDESDVLPPHWEPSGVFIPYNFQAIAGTGWHEYIVMMKMQTSNKSTDGEFHFFVDGNLIGIRKNLQFTDFDGDCAEAWCGWMVYPYFQLNGTTTDGGLIWLDDFSMDDEWNSLLR